MTTRFSTFVRDLNDRQKLWRTSEPFPCERTEGESAFGKRIPTLADHIVSSVCSPTCTAIQGCPECYLFAADSSGKIIDWCELQGSQKNTTDHLLVMRESEFPPEDPTP